MSSPPSFLSPGSFGTSIAVSVVSFLVGASLSYAHLRAQRSPCVCPAASPTSQASALITLVGGGPGAPELLTLAGLSALRSADVVITDLIAAKELRALAPAGAEFHVADKVPGNADSAQASVNAIGLAALRAGKRVVRLKVGDPFLYGRGGEEVEFFRAHGFEPVVVPGVSAALAAPISAGIPVTHRGVANQLLISTGQGRGGTFPDLPQWEPSRTLVLLMAVGRAGKLRADLCDERGYPVDTPVAVIERGTQPDERITRTTLLELAAVADELKFESPAVIVVGGVVEVGQPQPLPSLRSGTPLILLVDNGSLRAESYVSLRTMAAAVSSLSKLSVVAASARFADRAVGLSPPGDTVETTLSRYLRGYSPSGAATAPRLVVLPAFFGLSDTLTQLVPAIVARHAAACPALRLTTAAPLVDITNATDTRIASALRDGVLFTLAGLSLTLESAAVVLCDHGSPVPEVGAVRNHLAAQLRALLPSPRAFAEASMERRAGAKYDYCDPLLEVLLRTPPFNDGLVVVALAFLSPGKHAGPGGDLVTIAEAATRDAAAAGRTLRVLFTPLLGASAAVAEVLCERLRDALDGDKAMQL